jgi:hypothetical protein
MDILTPSFGQSVPFVCVDHVQRCNFRIVVSVHLPNMSAIVIVR